MEEFRKPAKKLHGGGSIVMQADAPENELAFDGFEGLLFCAGSLKLRSPMGSLTSNSVSPDAMPKGVVHDSGPACDGDGVPWRLEPDLMVVGAFFIDKGD